MSALKIDKSKKLKALTTLSDTISKKTPRQMKDYMQSFRGTDMLDNATQEEDDDLVNNIRKTRSKK